MGVEFATSNPAVAAFQTAMKNAADARMQDVKLRQETLGLEEGTLSAPSRIARVRADARIATTAADVAEGTKGANIKIAYNTATSGDLANQGTTVDLGEKRATSPSRVGATIATNTATTDQAPLGTVQKRSDVNERVITSPYRVQDAQSTARIGAVDASQADLKNFKESLALIHSGRIEEGKELAKRGGSEIPDAVLQNTALIGQLKQISDEAETRYPNRPKAQLDYIKEASKTLMETQGGPAAASPSQRYNVPGAPAPDVSGASKNSTPLQQNVAFLVQKGIAANEEEAFDKLQQSKTDPQGMLRQIFDSERKVLMDAAKTTMIPIDNKKMAEIEQQAQNNAAQKVQTLRQMAATMTDIPRGAKAAVAQPSAPAAAAPAVPAAPPVPAAPAPSAPAQPASARPWWRGGGGPADPAAEYSGAQPAAPAPAPPAAAPAPAAAAAPPKEQGRMKIESAEQFSAAAKGADPEALRQSAAKAIQNGKDRATVLQWLTAAGVSTAGL